MRMRFSPVVVLSVLLSSINSSASAAHSFTGPQAVPVYHPLCLLPLKEQQSDGGAFDMDNCALQMQGRPVTRIPEEGFFARIPGSDSNGGEREAAAGYVAYRPVGVLDDSLELLLVQHLGAQTRPATSAIYVVGRIPPNDGQWRDFITEISAPGHGCNGGIQSARLVSEAVLEVDLNINPAFFKQQLHPEDARPHTEKNPLSAVAFNQDNLLDDAPTSCIGTLTKGYNLLENKEFLIRVDLLKLPMSRAGDAQQRCFNQRLAAFSEHQTRFTIEELAPFWQLFDQHCR